MFTEVWVDCFSIKFLDDIQTVRPFLCLSFSHNLNDDELFIFADRNSELTVSIELSECVIDYENASELPSLSNRHMYW